MEDRFLGGIGDLRNRVHPELSTTLGRAVQLGFLGRMPIPEQIDHALGFVGSVESVLGRPPRSVIDLGSGGGVPGLIIASCWPESHVVLLDANERRVEFLQVESEALFPGVTLEVLRGRAEEVARVEGVRGSFELSTARSFGSPAVTAECGAPLLSIGGLLIVSEPPNDERTVRWPPTGVSELGLVPQDTVRFDQRFNYQVLAKVTETPERYPRRVGIPAKRPLF